MRRFGLYYSDMGEEADGEYCLYAEVQAKDAEIERLRGQITGLEQLCEMQSDNLQRYAFSESRHNQRHAELQRELSVEKAFGLTLMIRLHFVLELIGANDEESLAEREQLRQDIEAEVSRDA